MALTSVAFFVVSLLTMLLSPASSLVRRSTRARPLVAVRATSTPPPPTLVTSSPSSSPSSSSSASSPSLLRNVILFDGVCVFCNTWVDLLLRLDTKKQFKFAALQSPKGRELLTSIGRSADDISTVVLVKNAATGEAYYKSKAVLKVVEQMGLPLFLASAVGSAIPPFIRDGVYDGVANNRYSLMGKRDTCRCADPTYSDRFLT